LPGFGEARKGAPILSIGPECMMADTAFIAAGNDEGCVIEMVQAELLLRCSVS